MAARWSQPTAKLCSTQHADEVGQVEGVRQPTYCHYPQNVSQRQHHANEKRESRDRCSSRWLCIAARAHSPGHERSDKNAYGNKNYKPTARPRSLGESSWRVRSQSKRVIGQGGSKCPRLPRKEMIVPATFCPFHRVNATPRRFRGQSRDASNGYYETPLW